MGGVIEVPVSRFEELVAEALDTIPPELSKVMENVVVVVVDDPPEPGLLGLYTGIPLTEREASLYYYGFASRSSSRFLHAGSLWRLQARSSSFFARATSFFIGLPS